MPSFLVVGDALADGAPCSCAARLAMKLLALDFLKPPKSPESPLDVLADEAFLTISRSDHPSMLRLLLQHHFCLLIAFLLLHQDIGIDANDAYYMK